MSSEKAPIQTALGRLAARRYLVAALFISTYILISYYRSLQNALLRLDDLLILADVQKVGPFQGFLPGSASDVWFGVTYFRPFFILQAWLYYHLFGLNYAYYQAAGLIMHFVAVFILYMAIYRIGQNQLAALLLALVFAGHVYVGKNVTWVSDTATLTGISVGLALLLVTFQKRGWAWHLSMVMLLLLAPLTRENGLALNLSVAGFALVSLYVGNMNKKEAGLIVIESLLTVLAYFIYRRIVLGSMAPTAFSGSTAVFTTMYGGGEIRAGTPLWQAWIYSYTIVANVIANVFPIFAENGYLSIALIIGSLLAIFYSVLIGLAVWGWRPHFKVPRNVLVILSIFTALMVGLFYVQSIKHNIFADPQSFLTLQYAGSFVGVIVLLVSSVLLVTRGDRDDDTYPWVLGGVLGINGLVFFVLCWRYFAAYMMDNPIVHLVPFPIALSFVSHSGISAGILYSFISFKKWQSLDKTLALLGVFLILGTSILAFPYFRFRTHYIGLMGWLIVAVLGLRYLYLRPAGREIRTFAALVLSSWIVVNGAWNWLTQSQYTVSHYEALCDDRVPVDVALEVASYYGINVEDVLECRSNAR